MFFWLLDYWRLLSLGKFQTPLFVSLKILTVKQPYLFLLSSVESGDIDLSEYQDQDANGENVDDTDDTENPGNGDEDQQNGATEPASATAGTLYVLLFSLWLLSSFHTLES